jgi:hypothetical protein
LSGELRHILQEHLSGASLDARQNTEQTKP